MKRRTLLAGAAAALASSPVAAICSIPPQADPALVAIAEWRRVSRDFWGLKDAPEDVMLSGLFAESAAAFRALTTVPITLEGFRAYCEFGADLSTLERESNFCALGDYYPEKESVDALDAEEMFMATLAQAARNLLPDA